MQEELITFETAKLAKEKGFKPKSSNTISVSKLILNKTLIFEKNNEIFIYLYLCELQKWLREVHSISVEVSSDWWSEGKNNQFEVNIYVLGNIENSGETVCTLPIFKTYEEALEIGLQEALKLI